MVRKRARPAFLCPRPDPRDFFSPGPEREREQGLPMLDARHRAVLSAACNRRYRDSSNHPEIVLAFEIPCANRVYLCTNSLTFVYERRGDADLFELQRAVIVSLHHTAMISVRSFGERTLR